MSTTIDLLAISQEEAVIRALSARMAIDYSLIQPGFFFFGYNHIDDTKVTVTLNARAITIDGNATPWINERSIQFSRAILRGLPSQRVMTVNWVSGMAMEHVLRALFVLHSFYVTLAELEFYDAGSDTWVALAETYRPPVGVMRVRFNTAQARIVPSSSEFQVELVTTQRYDIGEYLRIISAGTITGALQ
jgi:ABC-type ATPase with predicted acetyltransferase domain